MDYKMNIAGLDRNLPLCKVTDDLYIAAFILFNDVEITRAAATELLKKAPEFDVIITAESKGIPLAQRITCRPCAWATTSGKPWTASAS